MAFVEHINLGVIDLRERGRFLRFFSLKESLDLKKKNRSDRFLSFSGETLGDTGKMLLHFLVDLGETNKIDHGTLQRIFTRFRETPKNVKLRLDSKFFRGESLPTGFRSFPAKRLEIRGRSP